MKSILTILTIISFVLYFGACNKKKKSSSSNKKKKKTTEQPVTPDKKAGTTPTPTPTSPTPITVNDSQENSKVDCNQMWSQLVKNSPQGQKTKYQTTTETKYPQGSQSQSSVTQQVVTRETISSSNENSINTQVQTTVVNNGQATSPTTTNRILQKPTYVSNCENAKKSGVAHFPYENDLQWTGKTIAAKDVSLKVPAGTYPTRYTKGNVRFSPQFQSGAPSYNEGVTEIWTMGNGYSARVVKYVTVISNRYNTSQGASTSKIITKELLTYVP